MTTDGPTPTPCDDKVFRKGTCVLICAEVTPNRLESWVQKVAATSGQRVDWHFAGGRARVLALGNIARVQKAIQELMPELESLYDESIQEYGWLLQGRQRAILIV